MQKVALLPVSLFDYFTVFLLPLLYCTEKIFVSLVQTTIRFDIKRFPVTCSKDIKKRIETRVREIDQITGHTGLIADICTIYSLRKSIT